MTAKAMLVSAVTVVWSLLEFSSQMRNGGGESGSLRGGGLLYFMQVVQIRLDVAHVPLFWSAAAIQSGVSLGDGHEI